MSARRRARRASGLVAAGLVLALLAPAAADARIATGGSGRFAGAIDWLEWGAPFAWLGTGPVTRTSTTTVAGEPFVVSCTLSNFAGVGEPYRPGAYRPGDWSGDAFDDLYNIGGTGPANELVNGIFGENVAPATIVATLDFSCSATLGGDPFALGGVVFADAEQLNASEYVQAAVASSATWRAIDRVRSPAGCTAATQATRSDDLTATTLRLSGDAAVCASGPAVVAFADGATSGTMSLLGTGKSAAALGVFVPTLDHGDAPASYGDAAHAVLPHFVGGAPAPGGPAALFEPFALAGLGPPPTRLGASADDESEGAPAAIGVWPGTPYTRTAIACTGPGTVAGWIDFDADGSLGAGERSQSAPCSGSSVDLTWTVPGGVRAQAASVLRLRIAAAAADVAGPTGLARSGEVEDHPLAIDLVAPAAPAAPAGGPLAAAPPPPATTSADLQVVTRVDRSTVDGNRPITWRTSVTNRAGTTATGVVLRAGPSLPVAFTLARATAGTCTKAAGVRCELGTIAPGATATVTLTGRARVAGTLRTTLRVAAEHDDPTPADAVASATTRVRGRLRLGVTARESSVAAGGLVHHVVRVGNPGSVGVQRVRVCERLAGGLTYVSSSRRVVRAGGRLCWHLGTVARGASKSVRLAARAGRALSRVPAGTATVSGRGVAG